VRWTDQPLDVPRKGRLSALWEEWVTDNPFHWHESGLRPERSRWRSKWMWILGGMLALRVIWLGAGLMLIFEGETLALEIQNWVKMLEKGQIASAPRMWGAMLFIMATGLMNLFLILIPPHLAAKSWQRDNPEAWREHLGVVPVTSQRVIFAKSHLWLMLIFIGKAATLAVAALLTGAAMAKWMVSGELMEPVRWALEKIGPNIDHAMVIWLPIGLLEVVLSIAKSVLWWVLIFDFIILFGLQGMGPLVNLTLVGLVIMSIGGVLGFGVMLLTGLVALVAPGPAGLAAVQVIASAGEVAILGAGCWFLWRKLTKMVAKHYHLSA